MPPPHARPTVARMSGYTPGEQPKPGETVVKLNTNENPYPPSPRVFEAIACGGFLLCDRQRDVLALFRDGEHFVSFGDARELAEKARYFLDRPVERESIARQGRREVLQRHTYIHRLRELFSVVNRCGHERA